MTNQRVSFAAPALFFSRLEAFLSIHALDCSAYTELPLLITTRLISNHFQLDSHHHPNLPRSPIVYFRQASITASRRACADVTPALCAPNKNHGSS
jgi:hypothetical protein